MKEIGGYIEFEHYHNEMLYSDAVKLNCGRRAISYLILSNRIKRIWLPKYTCSAVIEPCSKAGIEIEFYHIGENFALDIPNIDKEDWLYVINYFGQLDNYALHKIAEGHERTIIDNAQSYFQPPIEGVDTIYTCRKYFGVADGAILFTSHKKLIKELYNDESFDNMRFLMGRFERTASEFYQDNVYNNERFDNQPLMKMSLLTENLLHSLDYNFIKNTRTNNFKFLQSKFAKYNMLSLTTPRGAYMYPLLINNGDIIREKLQKEKIYIPTLWPDVFNICNENELEYHFAKNILPLPIDQRYTTKDMEYIFFKVKQALKDI